MPKIVDHEARRREVGEAVWRVVRRDGLEGTTVRAVAAESGMSAGTMRHYFQDHVDLQRAAMAFLIERVAARVQAAAQDGPLEERALALLLELVPLDEERQAEAEVWFAFVAEARTQSAFRSLADESYERIRSVIVAVVAALMPTADPARLELETERLFALVDGLVLHAVQRPGLVPPERLRSVLRAHVDGLVSR